MDEENAFAKDTGERHAEPGAPAHPWQRASSSLVVDENQQESCSMSYLGFFVPFYLLPLIFIGSEYGGLMYCVLLPLLLWSLGALPKPVTALVHIVTLPLLGLMAPEHVASHYLAVDVLIIALLLFLVVVVDAWSELVQSLALGVCARFGLQRGTLFLSVCLCSFASAWLFSTAVASVTLLYFLDRICLTIFKKNLDRHSDVAHSSLRRPSQMDCSAVRPVHVEDQALFEQLAQVVLTLEKPERWEGHCSKAGAKSKDKDAAMNQGSSAAVPTTASVVTAVPEERREASANGAADSGTGREDQEDKALASDDLETRGTVGPAVPSSVMSSRRASATCPLPTAPELSSHMTPLATASRGKPLNRQQQEQRLRGPNQPKAPQQTLSQRPSRPTILESEADKPLAVSQPMDNHPSKLPQGSRQSVSIHMRQNSHQSQQQNSRRAGNIKVQPLGIPRFKWLRNINIFAGAPRSKLPGDTRPEPDIERVASKSSVAGGPAAESGRSDTGFKGSDSVCALRRPSAEHSGSPENNLAPQDWVAPPSIAEDDRASANLTVLDTLAEQFDVAAKVVVSVASRVTDLAPQTAPFHAAKSREISSQPANLQTATDKSAPSGTVLVTSPDLERPHTAVPTPSEAMDEPLETTECVNDETTGGARSSTTRFQVNRSAARNKRKSSGRSSRSSRTSSGRATPKPKKEDGLDKKRRGSVSVRKRDEHESSKYSGISRSSGEGERHAAKSFESSQSSKEDRQGEHKSYKVVPLKSKRRQPTKETEGPRSGTSMDEKSAPEHSPPGPSAEEPKTGDPAAVDSDSKLPDKKRADDEKTFRKSRRPSLSSVKISDSLDRHKDINSRKKTEKAAEMKPDTKERVKKVTNEEDSCPLRAPCDKDKEEQQPEIATMTGKFSTQDAPEKTKPAAVEAAGNWPASESASSTTPRAGETRGLSTDAMVKSSTPARASEGSLASRRSASSVVSFGIDVKEIDRDAASASDKPSPLAHLVELAPQKAPRRRRPWAYLTSSEKETTRRASSVDFGPTQFALISPLQEHRAVAQPLSLRRLSATTSRERRLSTVSPSPVSDSGITDLSRRPSTPAPIAARFRSHFVEEMPTSLCQAPVNGGQPGLTTEAAKTRSAFLLAPSVMCVLGGICSFHIGGNKRALRVLFPAAGNPVTTVNAVTWTIMTLPGAALALVTCSAIIWRLYLRPHEPEPTSPQNLAVINAAEVEGVRRKKHRGVKYAGAVYVAIFSLTYVPSLLFGADHRVALLGSLTIMTLATSLLTSWLRVAFEFTRNVWQMVPWGAVFLLGSTHVASNLLQARSERWALVLGRAQTYAVPQEVFKLVSTAFWHQRSPLEVQATLAIVTSILAETTNKQLLVDMMAPVIVRMTRLPYRLMCSHAVVFLVQAGMKSVHPAYLATPVIVGASSGFIMPTSVPFALLHEMAEVSFWRLFFIGLVAKVVVVATVLMTVNAAEQVGLLEAHTTPAD